MYTAGKNLAKPTKGLRLWPLEACLLTELVKTLLLSWDKSELEDLCIILPTLRLATLLEASLAKYHGACFQPQISTLESFIHIHSQDRPGAGRVLSDLEQRLLIARLIKTHDFTYLGAGHEDEMSLFFNELAENADHAAGFEKLFTHIAANPFHSDEHLDHLTCKIREVSKLFGLYQEYLLIHRIENPADHRRLNGAHIQEKLLDNKSNVIPRHAYIVGFTSVLPSLLPFLKFLTDQDYVEIWLSAPPDSHLDSPLKHLIQTLGPEAYEHQPIPLDIRRPPAEVIWCHSPITEIKTALHAASDLVASGQTAAGDIAIVVTQENKYANLLHSMVKRLPLTTNLAVAITLQHTMLGAWLADLIEMYEGRFQVPPFLKWLAHPVTKHWLTKQDLGTLDLEHTLHRANKILAQNFAGFSINEIKLKGQDVDITTLIALVNKHLTAYEFTKTHPFQRWLVMFEDILFSFLKHTYSHDLPALETLAHQSLKDFFRAALEFSDIQESPWSPFEFFSFIKKNILRLELRTTGEPLAGVQILSLPESRYFPFQHVYLLGCNEGDFPKAMPRDEIIDDYFKRVMGLPGWQALEAREDLSFSMLQARTSHLHLLTSRAHGGKTQSPSRYVEKLVAAKACVLTQANLDYANSYSKTDTKKSAAALEGQLKRDRIPYFQQMSASSLEQLIQCSYRFLIAKLRIEPYPLPLPLKYVRKEGEWLHAILETFLQDPMTHQFTPQQKVEALSHLIAVTERLAPISFKKTAIFQHLKAFAWPRFIDFLFALFGSDGLKTLALGQRELKFGAQTGGLSKPFALTDDLTVTMNGKVDSFDRLGNTSLLIDFKRRSLPQRKLVGLGVSPQLSFYALALAESFSRNDSQDNQNLADIITGYWSILGGEWQSGGVGKSCASEAKERGLQSGRPLALEDSVQSMLELWRWRVKNLTQEKQNFAADPSACGLCDYASLCRKHDPLHSDRLWSQQKLNERLGKFAIQEASDD